MPLSNENQYKIGQNEKKNSESHYFLAHQKPKITVAGIECSSYILDIITEYAVFSP